VAGQMKALTAVMLAQGFNVGDQFVQVITAVIIRLGRFTITAHIRHTDPEARGGQWLNLVAPGVPAFGKAVQPNDQLAVSRAGFAYLQGNVLVVNGQNVHGASLLLLAVTIGGYGVTPASARTPANGCRQPATSGWPT